MHVLRSHVHSPHTTPVSMFFFCPLCFHSVRPTTISCLGRDMSVSVHLFFACLASIRTVCTWRGPTQLSFKPSLGKLTFRVGLVLLLVSLLSLSAFLTSVTLTYKYLLNLMSLSPDHRLLDNIIVSVLFKYIPSSTIFQVHSLTHKKCTINICLTDTYDYFFT